MTAVESQLVVLLYLFAIAAAARILATRYIQMQYTTGLVIAGLLISIIGSPVNVQLTSDVILLALLPTLIFNDAVNIDVSAFRENLGPILVLAVVGLLVSIGLVGIASQFVFGFPLIYAILFGAIIMPTDPVSVLAIFENLGVPERLNILVEGESLLNDGVSIVVYSTLLTVLIEAESSGATAAELVTVPEVVADIATGIGFALVGGLLVGGVVGYLAYRLIAYLNDKLSALVITVLVAYGVYLFLDLLGSSGVIGTLVAGVFLAPRTNTAEIPAETHLAVETIWEYGSFIANTIIFVVIGIITPFDLLVRYAPQIVAAIVLVFLARAVVIYPLVGLLNLVDRPTIPRGYQHVLTWSGIHASVSIALVLGLEEELSVPLTEELSALVFGVAAFTLLVNGPTMGRLIDRLGISKQRPAERLYEALVGRLHGVDAALDTAADLLDRDEIATSVFEDVTEVYRRERSELRRAIESLLETHPDIREHEERLGQHQILVAESVAIRDAVQRGEIRSDVGERLLADVDVELDRVLTDEWTIEKPHPAGYTPYWRRQLEKVRRSETLDYTETTPPDDASKSGERGGS
ncbi:cation:proton antiporter [Haloferax namakaokahaiae]|uniref:Cation:proton antiporter n=1 Tax=Haloferax namakaokahaiae TaxID=1748331 RepID=A0ABD5ZCW8_9EURY